MQFDFKKRWSGVWRARYLALALIGLLVVAAGCGGASMPAQDSTAAGIAVDNHVTVETLMAEIEQRKAELPEARPTETGDVARDAPTLEGPSSADDGGAQKVGERCREVATAICTSSGKICQISSRNPNESYFTERCQAATTECDRASTICSAY